jgi:hypothetical protein
MLLLFPLHIYCSACWVVTLSSLIITHYTPVSGHPLRGWLKTMIGLGVIVGCPSAILRLIYGVGTLVGSDEENSRQRGGHLPKLDSI